MRNRIIPFGTLAAFLAICASASASHRCSYPMRYNRTPPNVFPTVGQLRESGTNCRTAVSVARSIQLYQTARPQHPTPPKRLGGWTIRSKIESDYPVIPNPWWAVTAKHGQATVTFNEGS